MIEYLTTEDLFTLIGDLGVGPVRDWGLLDSAAHRPTTSLFGTDAYPSLDEKAAVLLESIVGHHALVDGNRPLGWLAVVVFYGFNGVDLDAPDDQVYDLVIAVASGAIPYSELAAELASLRSTISRSPAIHDHPAGLIRRCQTGAVISADEQTALVAAHNDWRARYNSPPLVWDDAVAAVAQDWADQLAASGQFDHRPDNQLGENIYTATADWKSAKDVVDGWGDEVASFDLPSQTCAPDAECGHFTQVVWSRTARLGCGKATGADGNDYWVCNYDPAGNMAGESPFS